MRALLALALLLPAAASAADCSRPRAALPRLIKRAMKSGQMNVAEGARVTALGWAAPFKSLLFDESEGFVHFFDVLVKPGKGEELVPTGLLLGIKEETAVTRHREFYVATLDGTLESVTFMDNEKDDKGELGAQKDSQPGIYTPRATMGYARELKRLCKASAKPSLEEALARDKAKSP